MPFRSNSGAILEKIEREREELEELTLKWGPKVLTYLLYDPFRVGQVHTELGPKITKWWCDFWPL